jgi:hypothetical protein
MAVTAIQAEAAGRSEPDRAERGETNRDRVRRILFVPMGFRLPRGADAEEHRRQLDHLADDFSYMSDANLDALMHMLKSKGQGSARNHWPDLATMRAYAELVQPRPIAEMPALRRWFGSVEGPRAREAGTLVEMFQYFERHKAPPVTPGARAIVADRAAENARRLQVIRERRDAGLAVQDHDLQWETWYLRLQGECEALVATERALRQGAVS